MENHYKVKYEVGKINDGVQIKAFLAKNKLMHIVKVLQGDQDYFYAKEMLISLSIFKSHKNPWIWEGLRIIHFILTNKTFFRKMANFTEREKGLRPSYTNRDKSKFDISDKLTQFTWPVQLK